MLYNHIIFESLRLSFPLQTLFMYKQLTSEGKSGQYLLRNLPINNIIVPALTLSSGGLLYLHRRPTARVDITISFNLKHVENC